MSDDLHSAPPPDDERPDDDSDDYGELERALRALFAPVTAPRAFRERLKAELLRDAEPLMAGESPPAGPTPHWPQRVGAPFEALTAHPRIASLASAALALAAALLLSITLRGLVPQMR